MNYPTPSREELDALQAFANAYGRKWREELGNVYWYNARIWSGGAPGMGNVLHSIRNNYGPTWLFDVCTVKPALDLAKLSAAKLHEEIARRSKAHSAQIDAMIAAGHGQTRGSEIRDLAKGSGLLSITALARAYVATADAQRDAYNELEERKRWHGSDKPIKRRA